MLDDTDRRLIKGNFHRPKPSPDNHFPPVSIPHKLDPKTSYSATLYRDDLLITSAFGC